MLQMTNKPNIKWIYCINSKLITLLDCDICTYIIIIYIKYSLVKCSFSYLIIVIDILVITLTDLFIKSISVDYFNYFFSTIMHNAFFLYYIIRVVIKIICYGLILTVCASKRNFNIAQPDITAGSWFGVHGSAE